MPRFSLKDISDEKKRKEAYVMMELYTRKTNGVRLLLIETVEENARGGERSFR